MYKNLTKFTASDSPAACRSLARVIITNCAGKKMYSYHRHVYLPAVNRQVRFSCSLRSQIFYFSYINIMALLKFLLSKS